MLEIEIPDSVTPIKHDLSDQEKRYFAESYLHASSGILDLFTERDYERLLCPQTESQYPRSPDSISDSGASQDSVCLDLIIAIGAQCQPKSDMNHYISISYFRRAQKAAFAGMLQTPTVDLARSFALMAFYMLGACSRNSALILQTGKSVRVLDLICNTILGRPGSTPVITDELEYLDGEICPNYATLCATYEAVAVLQSVVNDTKEKEGIPISKAEGYLAQLREWSSKLPPHLRRQSLGNPSSQSIETRRATVGKIHLACIYYYGVIQVTRQFLIDHIVPSVCGGIFESADNGRTSELAKGCTEAALLMAQICDDAESAGALLGNMCILKAWLFSAGLVLGFSLLRPHDQMEETRQAFQGTSRILARFGINSPQAAQYHSILSSFAEAIDRHERKSRSDRSRRKNSSVEKILSFEDPEDTSMSTARTYASSPWGSSQTIIGNFQDEDPLLQLDWSIPNSENEILRMFLDPCLESFMSLPATGLDWNM
ncbi:hypothetical protein N7468_000571 [Penicillium chermesinum]|uniref:Transcription factor domain-containing protein n=1 Tax=Penicillium chermesinum TaxID=63820 RepID=A0A9W9PKJ6_9EURO|nr:uncharacterized protein N7468_000571 [Penicillium chermesinum]KAJ5249120.1 hypothetical protein N7468_000571 [Penicillium chermesinum]